MAYLSHGTRARGIKTPKNIIHAAFHLPSGLQDLTFDPIILAVAPTTESDEFLGICGDHHQEARFINRNAPGLHTGLVFGSNAKF